MRPFTLFLIAGCGFAADLFRDDFSRFPPGLLSQPMGQLNGAIQEYHYIEHRGVRTHPWRNPIVHLDSWAVSDEDGKPYIEQHLVNADTGRTTPLFVTGDEGAAGATAGRRRSGRRNGDRSPVRLSFTTRSVRVKGRRGTIRSPSTRIETASRSS
jgi:hypothetical protein